MPYELDPLIAAQLTQRGSEALHQHLARERTPGVLRNQHERLTTLLGETLGKAQDVQHDPRLTPEGRRTDLLALGQRAVERARQVTETLHENNVTRRRGEAMTNAALGTARPAMAPALREELADAARLLAADETKAMEGRLTLEASQGLDGLSPAEVLLLTAADEPDVPVLLAVEDAGRWWRDLHQVREGVLKHALQLAARRSNPTAAAELDVLDELARLLKSNLGTFVTLVAGKFDIPRETLDPKAAQVVLS